MAVFFWVSVAAAVFLVAAWVFVLAVSALVLVFAAAVLSSFPGFLVSFPESLLEPEPESWSNDPVSKARAMLTVDANAAMCAAPKRWGRTDIVWKI